MFFKQPQSDHYIVHILIPYFSTYQSLTTPDLRLEALEKLLSRAYIEKWAYPEWMSSLFALFGMPVASTLPVAPITRLYDANDGHNKIWLRADPVHLYPDRDRVLLFDINSLTQNESDQFIHLLNELYQPDQLQFSAPVPTRWYVSLPNWPQLITTPLPQVLGQDIYNKMPEGQEKMQWRLRLNEIQMLLSQNRINEVRETRGERTVNSVWFWGLGQLPKPPISRWAHVWSNDPLALGLARLTQTPQTEVPTTGEDWLAHLTPGEHLLTLPLLDNDWNSAFHALEKVWFMPLFNALKKRQLDMVALYLGDERVFVITDIHIRHWWKRAQNWQRFWT